MYLSALPFAKERNTEESSLPYFFANPSSHCGSTCPRDIIAPDNEVTELYQGPGNLDRGWKYMFRKKRMNRADTAATRVRTSVDDTAT
jgi:hypothetical protein